MPNMKLLLIAGSLLQLTFGASITKDISCPHSCSCIIEDENLAAKCTTYEFIKKLTPKQQTSLTSLSISNGNLLTIDPKLKYLKNLHELDLSNNTISRLPSEFPYLPKLKRLNLSKNLLGSFGHLPKNLQILDLSQNFIEDFPRDWTSWKHLEQLHFGGNPINCDCENVGVFHELVKSGIVISGDLVCSTPKKFHERYLSSINCNFTKDNLFDVMLGDDSGSGLEEFDSHDEIQTVGLIDDKDEFINAGEVSGSGTEFEGSGDEGSGYGSIPVLPCQFNCSTPTPVGSSDEENASVLPELKEQVRIIFEDIFQSEKVQEATTVPPRVEIPILEIPKKEVEDVFIKKTDKDVEVFPTNDTVIGEMERASVLKSNDSKSLYIVFGLLMAFIAFLLIYFLNKRRNNRRHARRRNKDSEHPYEEKLKPLENPKEMMVLTKIPPESAPLLNGKNDAAPEGTNGKVPNEADEPVELRKSEKDVLLTPQLERVTIKVGDLPDSIAKTPLLVHRSLNSDGEIITTAVPVK